MSSFILLGDSKVQNIPVKDNKEPMVDFFKEFNKLRFDLKRVNVQKQSPSISWGRKEVGRRLLDAEVQLQPMGIRFLMKECYRPMIVQKTNWDHYYGFLQKKHPAWSAEELFAECAKFNAPLDVAPHTTGGAFDITLMDKNGEVLDMGTDVNASPIKTEQATYMNAKNISKWAKKNRALLSGVLTEAGFINYPASWWHWSYGDKYWALQTQAPAAIYGSVEVF